MNNHFDIESFRQHLSTRWLGQSVQYFEELESTSSYARELPVREIAHGMFCITDNQTKGRGQYDRRWESEPGQNLTFSLVFTPQQSAGFHVLTLACALAIVEHLNEFVDDQPCACIKWPNDVMLNDKKVGGLLTESIFSGNKLGRLIIGIGLNVNQREFSPEVADKATSISLEKGEKIDRERLLSEILSRIEHKYTLWQQKQKDLLKAINRNIEGYGQWVQLKVDGQLLEETYKMLGINEQGQLLMLNHEGGIESFSYEQIRIVSD